MKSRNLFVLLYLCQIGWAQAEIYKSVDAADGHVTYSSAPSKGAKKLGLEQTPVTPPSAQSQAAPRSRSAAAPRDFPKVDSGTQKNRDNVRHKILDDELNAEENLLTEARQNLKAGEDSPEYLRDSYGRPTLTPQYKAKIDILRSQVSLHEKNIDALKSELINLK